MDDDLPPEVMQKLKQSYLQSLPERLEAIRKAIADLRAHIAPETISALRFLVHKMAGNAGTFGFGEVTRLCREWEAKLARPESCAQIPNLASELEAFFAKIQQEFQSHG